MACYKFKEKNREPVFFGVGNVTELLDSDSTGVNALLGGIAMESEQVYFSLQKKVAKQ